MPIWKSSFIRRRLFGSPGRFSDRGPDEEIDYRGERYKRPFDLIALAIVYLAFLPLWVLVWTLVPLLIYLESGRPIFYRQKRLGKHGKPFLLVKFRTMIQEADQVGSLTTEVNDSRVTRVGRFLRRCYLDELPQTLNILRGEMSIVGPRPIVVSDYEADDWAASEFSRRLAVRPGVTGLAQFHRDAWATRREKLRFDLLYIRNMCPWLDIKLIMMTIFIVLRGSGGVFFAKGRAAAPASDAEDGESESKKQESRPAR